MATTDKSENGERAVRTLREFLTRMGLLEREERFDEGVAFLLGLDGPTPEAIAQILIKKQRFIVRFSFQGAVPVAQRQRMAEFIVRANYGLIAGNFEMNWESGALNYKSGIDFTSAELAEPLIRNAMLSAMDNIDAFARYVPFVLNGTMTPEEANRSAREAARDEGEKEDRD